MSRLSKDEYLWHIAFAAAKRGTCDRLLGGTAIGREGILIATGYNGSAPGEQHCSEAGHDIVEVRRVVVQQQRYAGALYQTVEHCIRTIHSEINAIISSAILGVSIDRADWYLTGVPCPRCSHAIARLHPRSLWVCSDRGAVQEDLSKNMGWWKSRQARLNQPETIHQKTWVELEELSIT